MGHENAGDVQRIVQLAQPAPQFLANLGVQRAEWLIEQQYARLDRQGAGQGDPLPLAAGQLRGIAPGERRQLDQVQEFVNAGPNHALGGALPARFDPQSEGDVVEHGHVPEQRVMLEHETDLAVAHVGGGGVLLVEKHLAVIRRLQTGDDPQQGGFAAAGWPQQAHQFAGWKIQRDVVEGDEGAKPFGDVLHANAHADTPWDSWPTFSGCRPRHSTRDLTTKVSNASNASSEATANAAAKLYSL